MRPDERRPSCAPNALNMAGILAGEQGEFDAARANFNAALEDARAVGLDTAISSALVNLGNLAFFGGDLDGARELYKESIEHFESQGTTCAARRSARRTSG